MTPLTDELLGAVVEMGGDPGSAVRAALRRWYGEGSPWSQEDPVPPGSPPCGELAPALCDGCLCRGCRPYGSTLLMEVCAVLWPWAADAILRRERLSPWSGRRDDGPYGENGEIYY